MHKSPSAIALKALRRRRPLAACGIRWGPFVTSAAHTEDGSHRGDNLEISGTVGPGSLGTGTPMPLGVIDKRLQGFRVFCHGERPKTMLPQNCEQYVHLMMEVLDDDPQPRPDRFQRPGFYQVVGLRVADAAFLFAPP